MVRSQCVRIIRTNTVCLYPLYTDSHMRMLMRILSGHVQLFFDHVDINERHAHGLTPLETRPSNIMQILVSAIRSSLTLAFM